MACSSTPSLGDVNICACFHVTSVTAHAYVLGMGDSSVSLCSLGSFGRDSIVEGCVCVWFLDVEEERLVMFRHVFIRIKKE